MIHDRQAIGHIQKDLDLQKRFSENIDLILKGYIYYIKVRHKIKKGG